MRRNSLLARWLLTVLLLAGLLFGAVGDVRGEKDSAADSTATPTATPTFTFPHGDLNGEAILAAPGDVDLSLSMSIDPNNFFPNVGQSITFIIDIVIFAQNNLQEILDYVDRDNVQQIKELLEWIGIIVGSPIAGGVSLYKLITFLKGKPKTVEKIKPDEIRYTGEDGNSITVPKQVHQLFQNCTIQNVFYNGFGKPLEQNGISKIETYLKDDNKSDSSTVEFSKKEAGFLKDYSDAEVPSLDSEEVVETKMEVFLSPKRGSFDADPRQWSFRMGGADNQIITATIKDEEFLEDCKIGKVKPHHTDVLKVRLIQKIKKINEKLDPNSISFEVEKVLEYQTNTPQSQTSIDNE